MIDTAASLTTNGLVWVLMPLHDQPSFMSVTLTNFVNTSFICKQIANGVTHTEILSLLKTEDDLITDNYRLVVS